MPWAQMLHIVFHWTAGGNEARADDRKHYHLLVEQVDSTAKLVRGPPSIVLNNAPPKPGYTAHIHDFRDALANKQQAALQERTDKRLAKMEAMPAPRRRRQIPAACMLGRCRLIGAAAF